MDGLQVLLDVSEYQSVAQLDQLLRNADDEIVGVYIKATQGEAYRDELANAFAICCIKHNTDFGYYDYMTNDQAEDQAAYFKSVVSKWTKPSLIEFLDCEGSYAKGAAGVKNWNAAYGGQPSAIYAQLSNMPYYTTLPNPKFVAQYDRAGYYRPSVAEIQSYKDLGYAAWQFTSSYMGLNQDAYVLLVPIERLEVA